MNPYITNYLNLLSAFEAIKCNKNEKINNFFNNTLLNNNNYNINQNYSKNKMIGKKRKNNFDNHSETKKNKKIDNKKIVENKNIDKNKDLKLNLNKICDFLKYQSMTHIYKTKCKYSNNKLIPCFSFSHISK